MLVGQLDSWYRSRDEYICLWLQCFDPYLGHRQAYRMNLGSVVHV
jgi:hypothetical protein